MALIHTEGLDFIGMDMQRGTMTEPEGGHEKTMERRMRSSRKEEGRDAILYPCSLPELYQKGEGKTKIRSSSKYPIF